MGWAYCGQDDQGRDIGYAIAATCDHPGCKAEIDRGLAYVCGGMHGGDGIGCGKYFCEEHRTSIWHDGHHVGVCLACAEEVGSDDDDDAGENGGPAK